MNPDKNQKGIWKNGRSDRIRTCDVLLPKQVLYQAELRSDYGFHWCLLMFLQRGLQSDTAI